MRKKWKKCLTVTAVSIITMASSITSHAQWMQVGSNWYYQQSNGSYVTGWYNTGNNWYYFNQSGQMLTGWHNLNATWYYFVPSGEMVTGWKNIDGKWYYFRGDGSMVMSQWVGNYYLGESGAMETNSWVGPYYVGADGAWIQNYGQSTSVSINTAKEDEKNYTWLKDMVPADGKADSFGTYTDTLSNKHNNATTVSSSYMPTYYVNGKYSYIIGTIAPYKSYGSNAEEEFIIRNSDGEEIYSETIKRLTEPITFKVNITGEKFITIEGTGEYRTYWGERSGDLIIVGEVRFVQ